MKNNSSLIPDPTTSKKLKPKPLTKISNNFS